MSISFLYYVYENYNNSVHDNRFCKILQNVEITAFEEEFQKATGNQPYPFQRIMVEKLRNVIKGYSAYEHDW
jgi:hypothetical protein